LVKIANALDLAEHRDDSDSASKLRREYQNPLEKQARAQSIFAKHAQSHLASPGGAEGRMAP
jgi:hypothetical protein